MILLFFKTQLLFISPKDSCFVTPNSNNLDKKVTTSRNSSSQKCNQALMCNITENLVSSVIFGS